MAQISRLHEAQIANGNVINATDLNDEFNQLINESNSQDTRVTALESGTMTIGGTKTFSSIPVLPTADPTTDNQAVRKGYVVPLSGGTMTGLLTLSGAPTAANHAATKSYVDGLLKGLWLGAPPAYGSASTITLASFSAISSAGTGMITKNTPSTVNIANTGLDGVAQSAALAGTVAVTNGSTTVTGTGTAFTTDFQVGDVIAVTGAQTRRITAIASATSLTVEANFTLTASGATYRRGGEAQSTWYYLYAISDGVTPGLILSTRNTSNGDVLVDLPNGYTQYRQCAIALRNDVSSNLMPFLVAQGWPYRPLILYNSDVGATGAGASTTTVLHNGTATSFTDVDCSNFIPPVSRMGYFNVTLSRAASSFHYLRPNGESHNGYSFQSTTDNSTPQKTILLGTDSSQIIEYKLGSAGGAYIAVAGFVVTEVNG